MDDNNGIPLFLSKTSMAGGFESHEIPPFIAGWFVVGKPSINMDDSGAPRAPLLEETFINMDVWGYLKMDENPEIDILMECIMNYWGSWGTQFSNKTIGTQQNWFMVYYGNDLLT